MCTPGTGAPLLQEPGAERAHTREHCWDHAFGQLQPRLVLASRCVDLTVAARDGRMEVVVLNHLQSCWQSRGGAVVQTLQQQQVVYVALPLSPWLMGWLLWVCDRGGSN